MVGNIIVACICNLLAVLILVSGIFTARSNGLKVTLVKFIIALGGLVGAYFLVPTLSNKLYSIEKIPEFLSYIGASLGTVNSCIFFVIFFGVYALDSMICAIVKRVLIKRLQDKKVNKAKIKRARSINPRAEKAVRIAEWRKARSQFKENRKWYTKALTWFLGVILGAVVGVIVLMPFGFIGKDIKDGDVFELETEADSEKF